MVLIIHRLLLHGKCTNSVASGWAPIASQQLDITLAPGEDEDPMSSY